MHAPTPGPWWPPIVCVAIAAVWYPLLTWLLGFGPSEPLPFGLAFNSMAEHLLAGRFDIDPDAIGAEGFESGGQTVAYFGIFCALLRVPLVLMPGFSTVDITWWSCLAAAWLATWFQVRAVILMWTSVAHTDPEASWPVHPTRPTRHGPARPGHPYQHGAATGGPDEPHKHQDKGETWAALFQIVMARLVRATRTSTVPRPVARTSRAMTMKREYSSLTQPYRNAFADEPGHELGTRQRNSPIGRRPASARPDSSTVKWLAIAMLVSIVLGGQHTQFLRPSLWQEPISWALAQAMGFVYLAGRGFLTQRGFDRRTLCLMALCAGLALLTRVSFGIGLYAAMALFLLVCVRPREWPLPAAVLLIFIALTGIVNAGRWGNPFVFADFTQYGLALDAAPDRLGRLAAYGTFHAARVWLGLGYYFAPIWIWVRTDGHVLFAEAQATLVDSMELPAGSFLLTDPLLLGLAAVGVWRVRDLGRAALLLGLCVPPVLMLCAISMAHRYRMEFYPVLFLASLFGLAAASAGKKATPRCRIAIIGCVVIGIAASHAMALAYARSPWGPGDFYLERYGLIGTYSRPSR